MEAMLDPPHEVGADVFARFSTQSRNVPLCVCEGNEKRPRTGRQMLLQFSVVSQTELTK